MIRLRSQSSKPLGSEPVPAAGWNGVPKGGWLAHPLRAHISVCSSVGRGPGSSEGNEEE